VLRYNGTTGEFIDVFAAGGGLNFPTFLAFTPRPAVNIPESSSLLGLLLLGAGLVALGTMRRQGES
jgi:hypothetical protein